MKIKVLFLILIFIVLCQYDFVNAARGCCSWHGGIAGCDSSGRYMIRMQIKMMVIVNIINQNI